MFEQASIRQGLTCSPLLTCAVPWLALPGEGRMHHPGMLFNQVCQRQAVSKAMAAIRARNRRRRWRSWAALGNYGSSAHCGASARPCSQYARRRTRKPCCQTNAIPERRHREAVPERMLRRRAEGGDKEAPGGAPEAMSDDLHEQIAPQPRPEVT